MSEQLKPCPFCGGEAKAFWGDDGCGFGQYYIECGNSCEVYPCISDCNKAEATEQWNTRALTPKQQCADEMYAMIEKMVMDIEEDMFESWLDKNSPSGDSECVYRQWRDSCDYLHFLSEFKDELSLLAKARGEA